VKAEVMGHDRENGKGADQIDNLDPIHGR
jgi:hypothetical protein